MPLPLPRLLYDIGPGGGIVTSMQGQNALSGQLLDNHLKQLKNKYYAPSMESDINSRNALTEYQKLKNKYAPTSLMAEAASKLAYAKMLGPQFLAKAINNDSFLANLSDDQKRAVVGSIYGAGSNNNQIMNTNNPLQSNNIPQQGQMGVQPSSNPMQNLQSQNVVPNNPINYPDNVNVLPGSFSENVGNYKGIVSEGQESGKIRAKDIEGLNNSVFSGENSQSNLDNISKILKSKEFEQIRQVPLAGHHELSYYSKFGTPEQQRMIGQYYTLTGNIIKENARDFGGQFRTGEQRLLNGMKPNPSDTVDTARGKLESLSIMNKMLTERSRITSEIMAKYHVNKLQALEQADKYIKGNKIREQIQDKIYPSVTVRNKVTGEKKTISASEARKLLGKEE